MNPYLLIGARLGVSGDDPILKRLSEWHDAMVAHERARLYDPCDDDCPHVQARQLWAEAVARFGPRSSELPFLRSRATRHHKAA